MPTGVRHAAHASRLPQLVVLGFVGGVQEHAHAGRARCHAGAGGQGRARPCGCAPDGRQGGFQGTHDHLGHLVAIPLDHIVLQVREGQLLVLQPGCWRVGCQPLGEPGKHVQGSGRNGSHLQRALARAAGTQCCVQLASMAPTMTFSACSASMKASRASTPLACVPAGMLGWVVVGVRLESCMSRQPRPGVQARQPTCAGAQALGHNGCSAAAGDAPRDLIRRDPQKGRQRIQRLVQRGGIAVGACLWEDLSCGRAVCGTRLGGWIGRACRRQMLPTCMRRSDPTPTTVHASNASGAGKAGTRYDSPVEASHGSEESRMRPHELLTSSYAAALTFQLLCATRSLSGSFRASASTCSSAMPAAWPRPRLPCLDGARDGPSADYVC